MTLDEAIKHAEEVAKEHEGHLKVYENLGEDRPLFEEEEEENECKKCTSEHRQLAEWLRELKQLREQTRWIPVSERLPEKEMDCLVTDSLGKVHKETFYHALDGRESYFSGCYCVRAWVPSPEPYKGESEDKE